MEIEETCDHFYAFKSTEFTDYDSDGIYYIERFECQCGYSWDRKTYKE